MTLIIWISVGILSVASVLTLIRIAQGPTMLNRAIAMDVLIAIVVCGLALEAVLNNHSTTLPVLVVLSLLGFVGSVSIARFAAREEKEDRT